MSTPIEMARKVWRHPSNEGARLRGLVRGGYHLMATRVLRRSTTTRLGTSSRIYVNPTRNASSRVVIGNPPDPGPMTFIARILRPGDLVVDVGANIGLYTIFTAEKGARLIAVESGDVTELRRNLALNQLEVEVIEAAVSSSIGTGWVTSGRDQEDHLVADDAAAGPASGMRQVRTVTVDSILDGRSARLVKVDVEGFERLVLEGMTTTLQRQGVDVLQLEWNDSCERALGESREPAARILEQHGYRLFRPTERGQLLALDSVACSLEDVIAISPRALEQLDLAELGVPSSTAAPGVGTP
jgi:FkbM family methyltransferase